MPVWRSSDGEAQRVPTEAGGDENSDRNGEDFTTGISYL